MMTPSSVLFDQDITQRLVEAVTAVASASLQQATWLSRNLSVKPRVFSDVDGAGKMDGSLGEDCVVEKVPQDRAAESVEDRAAGTKVSQQALMVLAQLVVPLLDVVYGGGEDRDKVTSLLTSVLSTVFPYLRHHRSVFFGYGFCTLISNGCERAHKNF